MRNMGAGTERGEGSSRKDGDREPLPGQQQSPEGFQERKGKGG